LQGILPWQDAKEGRAPTPDLVKIQTPGGRVNLSLFIRQALLFALLCSLANLRSIPLLGALICHAIFRKRLVLFAGPFQESYLNKEQVCNTPFLRAFLPGISKIIIFHHDLRIHTDLSCFLSEQLHRYTSAAS
jgi:hypothetical protein